MACEGQQADGQKGFAVYRMPGIGVMAISHKSGIQLKAANEHSPSFLRY
jgi:hypothetical protein